MPGVKTTKTFTCFNCGKVNSYYTEKGRKRANPKFCNGYDCFADYRASLSTAGMVIEIKSYKDWFLRSIDETFCFGGRIK